MDETKAREIIEASRNKWDGPYIEIDNKESCLDGYFTVDEIEAIAWWMRNKGTSV